jgi:AraC-like DNA-binding protein
MFDARSPATEERLARVMDDLAHYLSNRCRVEQNDQALQAQTLQLRDDLRRAVAHSRRCILDIAQSARAANGPAPSRAGQPTPRRPGLPAARLRRVLSYIDASLAEPVTVADLACVAGMSSSHFATLFKRSTGVAPHEAVLRRRIARAKELLREDGLTIAAIGCQLGFSSQAHFTTVFRRRAGLTPSAFRVRRRGAASGVSRAPENIGESCNTAVGI